MYVRTYMYIYIQSMFLIAVHSYLQTCLCRHILQCHTVCTYTCTNMHIYITQNRMNRTLLIANYNEARTFMFNKCPSDYGVAFTKEGHRAHRDHRCYSEKKQPRVVYLQASSDESLRFFMYMYTYIRMYYFYIICT